MTSEAYEVLAVRYGTRQASAAEVFLTHAHYDHIGELATGGARVVAGHDPLVAERFGGRAQPDPRVRRARARQ